MSRWDPRQAGAWATAALPASAGAPLYFVIPEPWGALLFFYLFLAGGALGGAFMARRGQGGPVALRFGLAFSIPAAVLPFSLLPAEGPGIVASTAAAWGLALAGGGGLGAFLAAPRLAGPVRSRLGAGWRAWSAFLAGGALGGAAATLLTAVLPAQGYFAAWGVGLVGSCAVGGGLFGPRR